MIKEEARFSETVDGLCRNINERISPLERRHTEMPLPNVAEVRKLVEMLRAMLFPGYFGDPQFPAGNVRYYMGATLDAAAKIMTDQVERSFCFFCDKITARGDAGAPPSQLSSGNASASAGGCGDCRHKSEQMVAAFMKTLPDVQNLLVTDVQAAYEGDPAATCPAETIFCYPGIMAITNQRIAHELYKLHVPLLPRMITELAHSATGIDIHPGAAIGRSFFIDHGTGVVIGETCRIGKRVKLYQGVTLGALSFAKDEHGVLVKGIKRHPDVEDNVVIYAGATILGGETVIGHDAVIG
ncbi:MAG: hypothetical protein WC881_11660, partial [Elusimicrobiota bacterium]